MERISILVFVVGQSLILVNFIVIAVTLFCKMKTLHDYEYKLNKRSLMVQFGINLAICSLLTYMSANLTYKMIILKEDLVPNFNKRICDFQKDWFDNQVSQITNLVLQVIFYKLKVYVIITSISLTLIKPSQDIL